MRSSGDVSVSIGRSARSGNGPIGSDTGTPAEAATASTAHVSRCTTRSRSRRPERIAVVSPNEPHASGPKKPIVSFLEQ